MTHASLELVWLMLGYALNDAGTFTKEMRDRTMENVACDVPTEDHERAYGWMSVVQLRGEHLAEVTCPRCLVAMDSAREGRALT